MQPARKPLVSDGARKADLAAIHIAKAALGWSDDFYRDILFAKCGVKSSALLDFTGRKRFLAHLHACGWQPSAKGQQHRSKTPLTPAQRLMWSLWQRLADAGKVTNRKMPALLSFVKRQTDVERLEWLTTAQEDMVIVSLKAWVKREGTA
jgi:phage gp16-like protein